MGAKKIWIATSASALALIVGVYLLKRDRLVTRDQSLISMAAPLPSVSAATDVASTNDATETVGTTDQTPGPSTKETVPSTSQDPLKSFLDRFSSQGGWNIQRNPSGEMHFVSGGIIPKVGTDETSAYQFAQEFAAQLSIDPRSIKQDSTQPLASPRLKSYAFKQWEGEHEVYDSYLTLFAAKENSGVIMINSGLREIGDLDTRLNVPIKDARKFAASYFNRPESGITLANDSRPVVYVSAPRQSEMAWVFTVDLGKGERAEVVISAKSEQRLLETKQLSMH